MTEQEVPTYPASDRKITVAELRALFAHSALIEGVCDGALESLAGRGVVL